MPLFLTTFRSWILPCLVPLVSPGSIWGGSVRSEVLVTVPGTSWFCLSPVPCYCSWYILVPPWPAPEHCSWYPWFQLQDSIPDISWFWPLPLPKRCSWHQLVLTLACFWTLFLVSLSSSVWSVSVLIYVFPVPAPSPFLGSILLRPGSISVSTALFHAPCSSPGSMALCNALVWSCLLLITAIAFGCKLETVLRTRFQPELQEKFGLPQIKMLRLNLLRLKLLG